LKIPKIGLDVSQPNNEMPTRHWRNSFDPRIDLVVDLPLALLVPVLRRDGQHPGVARASAR
jgi:hypothetical protein